MSLTNTACSGQDSLTLFTLVCSLEDGLAVIEGGWDKVKIKINQLDLKFQELNFWTLKL